MSVEGRQIVVDEVRVADDTDCYVIAEIGHNHQGDLEQCKQMFDAAKAAGASAVKLQKRDNRALFTRAAYDRAYESENAFGATYGEHREALEFGRDEYLELQQYAKELEITFFATAFDEPSADFLAEIDVPAYKIASGDLRSTPLLRYVAKIGKPVIVSTGAATIDDVQRAYDTIMPINQQLALLQCTAAYPPEYEQLDLGVIRTYRDRFPGAVIGFSGHDSGIAMSAVAYALGARIIEKHFTLNRAMRGTDHAFSLEPAGMRKLVRDLQRARRAMGDGENDFYETEITPGHKMGKSIVAARSLAAGAVLSIDDLATKSPGGGMWPYEIDDVVGRRLLVPMEEDQALSPHDLEPRLGVTAGVLSGRVAVVTGSAGQLGPVWVDALVGAGADVFAFVLPGTADATLEELARNRTVTLVDADVTDRESLERACTRVLDTGDAPHILVNNAGIDQPPAVGRGVAIRDIDPAGFLKVLEVNTLGAFQASQLIGSAMVGAGRGSIINIGSLYASVSPDQRFYEHLDMDPPFVKPPAYGASKAGLVNLTKFLSTHWGPFGVRVNALSPGGVAGGQDPRFVAKFSSRVPLGRLAEREELVGPLLFLASDASSYVTGIELKVDGGFTAW